MVRQIASPQVPCSSATPRLLAIWLTCLLFVGSPVVADESQLMLTPKAPATTPTESGRTNPHLATIDTATSEFAQHPSVLPSWIARSPSPRMLISLVAIVLGSHALVSTCLRKPTPTAPHTMQTVGQIQVTPKVKLHLVRLGNRLLLLHISDTEVRSVAEITDPDEVQMLIGSQLPDAARAASSLRVADLLRQVETSSKHRLLEQPTA